MAIRPVLVLPDRRLTSVARPIGEITKIEGAMASLVEDLVDTMRASPACVGIAAPQIGVCLRAFALDVSQHKKTTTCHGLIVMFDPVLIAQDDPVVMREGCMSVPDLTGDVSRPSRITVRGRDAEGQELTVSTEGFEARAFIHEMDHLDGKVFLDRVAGSHAVFRRKIYR